MTNHLEDTSINDCNTLLLQSCKLYKDLFDAYTNIEKDITSSPSIILKMNTRLNNIQQQAATVDKDLQSRLTHDPALKTNLMQLLAKREEILHKVKEKNRRLIKRATNIKTHIKHDLLSMNTNRNAINGYKPIQQGNTGRINNSF